jgi:uncharacterized repeat protein (TIGR01451 family)
VDTETSLVSANGAEIIHGGCQTTLFEPVLVITKTAPAQALVNDIVEYRIAVENTGVVVAHNTIITDNIRPGVNYIPGSASGDVRRVTTVEGDGSWEKVMLVWNIGDLQPGDSLPDDGVRVNTEQKYAVINNERASKSFRRTIP